MNESLNVSINGHVLIQDRDTKEVIIDQHNEIHPQNMAIVITRALSQEANGFIYNMCLGNGGTFLNSSNQIIYRPSNTVGAATLYNQTYTMQVDDQSTGTSVNNSVVSSPSPTPAITSIITVIAQLNANEPTGQAVTDGVTSDTSSPFMFDEVGLKTKDDLLLSHLVFSPFEKAANRAFLITYTLTVSVS